MIEHVEIPNICPSNQRKVSIYNTKFVLKKCLILGNDTLELYSEFVERILVTVLCDYPFRPYKNVNPKLLWNIRLKVIFGTENIYLQQPKLFWKNV